MPDTQPTATRPPVALSIAGTDPSGGAGIHADLKTFAACGAMGTTVIAALVAQNTHGVSRVYPIADDFVHDQFLSVLDDMPVDATKSGMLSSRSLIEMVVRQREARDFGFYTVDPVMVATSGHRLLEAEAVDVMREALLPVADLITPNLPEAALLLGNDVPEARSVSDMREQAGELIHRGVRAVLLKGGMPTERTWLTSSPPPTVWSRYFAINASRLRIRTVPAVPCQPPLPPISPSPSAGKGW